MYIRRSSAHVVVQAPAKVNLFLEVLARRADGFHEIETLMAAITLYDTLAFTATSDPAIELRCDWAYGWAARALHTLETASPVLGDVPQGGGNIVYRAVALLRERAGISAGASLRLTKRIPSAAGLGGASSDAAAALLAANVAWELNWSRGQLREVAAELGSDIPFFLGDENGPAAALCRGRGERIEPLRAGRLHLVIVRPPVGLSTPQVYARCHPASVPHCGGDMQAALSRSNLAEIGRGLWNRLQAPAAELTEWIGQLAERFERQHLAGHQMSGSGSSYFGICRHARHARRTAARLRGQQVGAVYQVTTLTST